MLSNIQSVIYFIYLFFGFLLVTSCDKPEAPDEPDTMPDTTIVIGFGNTVTIPIDTVLASFDFTNNYCTAPCSIAFNNVSYNADTYFWDFADTEFGVPATSTQRNPVYSYKYSGTYKVALKVFKNGKFDTDTQTVVINKYHIPNSIGTTKQEIGKGIVQTIDGGYLLIGEKGESFSKFDIYVIKLDASRNIVWEKTFGGIGKDEAFDVKKTQDGGFVIAGYVTRSEKRCCYIFKLFASGEFAWQRVLEYEGDSQVRGIAIAENGDIVVTGYVRMPGVIDWQEDVLLVRLNPNGNIIWQKQYGSDKVDYSYCIENTSDGGFLLGGFSWHLLYESLDSVSYILKTDSDGNLLFEKNNLATLWSTYSIHQTSDHGFILAGINRIDEGNAYGDLFKLDANYNLEWEKVFLFDGLYCHINCVRQTSDGGYIFCGVEDKAWYSLPKRTNLLIVKTDATGNTLWYKSFAVGAIYSSGYEIQQTSDGGYIVAGYLLAEERPYISTDYDIFLIKLDADGNVQ